MDSPLLIMQSIVTVVLSLIALVVVIGLIFFPILTVVFAIIENKQKLEHGGVKSWKKTKIFAILTSVWLLIIPIIVIFWGILNIAHE